MATRKRPSVTKALALYRRSESPPTVDRAPHENSLVRVDLNARSFKILCRSFYSRS